MHAQRFYSSAPARRGTVIDCPNIRVPNIQQREDRSTEIRQRGSAESGDRERERERERERRTWPKKNARGAMSRDCIKSRVIADGYL
jgi:hypothetical protein